MKIEIDTEEKLITVLDQGTAIYTVGYDGDESLELEIK